MWASSAAFEATFVYAWAVFVSTLVSGHLGSSALAVATFVCASLLGRDALREHAGPLAAAQGLVLLGALGLLGIHQAAFPMNALWSAEWIAQLLWC